VTGLAAAYYASALLLNGDAARAKLMLDGYLRSKSSVRTTAQATCLAVYGEACLSLGDAIGALEIADAVIDWSSKNATPGVAPRTWMLRGRALAALGRQAEAIETLQQASESAAEIESPVHWRIQLALGQSLKSVGRREQTGRAFAAARETVDRLAGTLDDTRASAAFRAAAFDLIPAAPRASQAIEAKRRYEGLTGREREVAALIAKGLSNKEIADRMMVGERTVETHSGHIREKLGLTSRAQVVAWAVEHGLGNVGP
jgi:DNA-binding NarL/FixJ family response regulator